MLNSNSLDSSFILSREQAASANCSTPEFTVRFWGVRRGVPTPTNETKRYGGNTGCVEMLIGNKRLIFDGGTGLRVLGKTLQQPTEAHIFFTHSHWDRIQGFPFFTPAFIGGNCFHIYGATAINGASIKQILCDQMLQPYFPYHLQEMQADLKFHFIRPGEVVTLEDVTIETGLIYKTHPAMGFRVTYLGHSVVYATDIEPTDDSLEPSLVQLAREADLLIANAISRHPSAQEDDQAMGTSWQAPVALAQAANVKQFALFHYDPEYDDDRLDQVKEQVHLAFPKSLLACEGMVLPII